MPLTMINQEYVDFFAKNYPFPVTGEELICYFITENKVYSRGMGWVDVNILVSALTEKYRVLTFDKNFEAICREFDCYGN